MKNTGLFGVLILGAVLLTPAARADADCSLQAVKQQRALFARTYQAGDYEAAYQQLNRFINGHQCRYPIAHADSQAPAADRPGYYWLYPDLMLGQYRTGRYKACRQLGDRFLTMGDSGARRYMSSGARKAVETNLRLCELAVHESLLAEGEVKRCAVEGYQDYWQIPAAWRQGKWDPVQKNILCVRLRPGRQNSMIGTDLNYQSPEDPGVGVMHQPRLQLLYLDGEDGRGQPLYGHQSLFIYEQQLVDERVNHGWGKAEDFGPLDRLFAPGHCGEAQLRFGHTPGQLMVIGDGRHCREPGATFLAKSELTLELHFPFYLELKDHYQVPIR